VAKAQQRLDSIAKSTVTAIRCKQAASSLLSKEAHIVHNMMSEGLLTEEHAEEFLSEITDDAARIEWERNIMYR
jgi:hypothetical protein